MWLVGITLYLLFSCGRWCGFFLWRRMLNILYSIFIFTITIYTYIYNKIWKEIISNLKCCTILGSILDSVILGACNCMSLWVLECWKIKNGWIKVTLSSGFCNLHGLLSMQVNISWTTWHSFLIVEVGNSRKFNFEKGHCRANFACLLVSPRQGYEI